MAASLATAVTCCQLGNVGELGRSRKNSTSASSYVNFGANSRYRESTSIHVVTTNALQLFARSGLGSKDSSEISLLSQAGYNSNMQEGLALEFERSRVLA